MDLEARYDGSSNRPDQVPAAAVDGSFRAIQALTLAER
jgi:hypothetical protein